MRKDWAAGRWSGEAPIRGWIWEDAVIARATLYAPYVNMLVEPRVPNGKTTMFDMSTSLALAGGDIIPLYTLWHAKSVEDQKFNAAVFGSVIDHLGLGSAFARHALLAAVLAFEARLLLVGSQSGFLDGPAVLSNMTSDSWVPRHLGEAALKLRKSTRFTYP